MRTKFYEENEKLLKSISDKNSQSGTSQGGSQGTSTTQSPIQAKKLVFIQNLKRLVDSKRVKPAGYDKLVRNIKSYTDVNMDMFNKNEVDSICQKYNLPADVKTKLKSIAFVSQASVTSDIKYLNDKQKASVEEILGYVMKESDTIFFAFIRSITTGEIPYRVKNVSEKKCHRMWYGKKSCHTEKKTVEDPYTAAELLTVKNAILALSAESLKNKLNTINESQTLLGEKSNLVSPDGKYKAVMSKDGRIYVGPAANPLSGTLYIIGTAQTEAYAPYSLQVKDNGNVFIINKNNDKVWSSNTSNQGVAPYKLVLNNDGSLNLLDSKNTVIFKGKK